MDQCSPLIIWEEDNLFLKDEMCNYQKLQQLYKSKLQDQGITKLHAQHQNQIAIEELKQSIKKFVINNDERGQSSKQHADESSMTPNTLSSDKLVKTQIKNDKEYQSPKVYYDIQQLLDMQNYFEDHKQKIENQKIYMAKMKVSRFEKSIKSQ